jgi:hypothetical protein
MSHGVRRHADQTELIDAVTIVLVLGLPVVGRDNRDGLRVPEAPAIDRMNVTKRQAKVDGERAGSFYSTCLEGQL